MYEDTLLSRLWIRWLGRPGLDWPIVLVITGSHLGAVLISGGGDVLAWPGREQRITIYTGIATVAALIGSFITAAIAQYASSTGVRMQIMRTNPRSGAQFRRNWVGILGATLVVSGLCLLAAILDTKERDPGGVHWLAETALLLGAVRAIRLVWLFGRVIAAADVDLADTPMASPPAPVRRPGA